MEKGGVGKTTIALNLAVGVSSGGDAPAMLGFSNPCCFPGFLV
jgi:anion-transporting  ArsA/GET3 family ATPase